MISYVLVSSQLLRETPLKMSTYLQRTPPFHEINSQSPQASFMRNTAQEKINFSYEINTGNRRQLPYVDTVLQELYTTY